MNLHPRYAFWTAIPGCGIRHAFFLWPRELCWVWCQWAHLEFPSPSGQISDLCKCLRGTLLETHPMNVLVNAGGVRSGHYVTEGGTALLATLLVGAVLPSLRWKGRAWVLVGSEFLFVQDVTDNKWESQDSIPVSLVPKSECFPVAFKVIFLMKIRLFFSVRMKKNFKLLSEKRRPRIFSRFFTFEMMFPLFFNWDDYRFRCSCEK